MCPSQSPNCGNSQQGPSVEKIDAHVHVRAVTVKVERMHARTLVDEQEVNHLDVVLGDDELVAQLDTGTLGSEDLALLRGFDDLDKRRCALQRAPSLRTMSVSD